MAHGYLGVGRGAVTLQFGGSAPMSSASSALLQYRQVLISPHGRHHWSARSADTGAPSALDAHTHRPRGEVRRHESCECRRFA